MMQCGNESISHPDSVNGIEHPIALLVSFLSLVLASGASGPAYAGFEVSRHLQFGQKY
jgi:hypothetical protein